ncbi:MAG: hypothetical protein IPO07_31425 [Haliscomenobacter sp.]|nr:hypothetical protein [Haliscomenobacter sp.]
MVTAMIAYLNLNKTARAKVDSLTAVLRRDYPQVNHFIVTGPWPDDLKADGVHAYDTWHYTDIPVNVDGIALPDAGSEHHLGHQPKCQHPQSQHSQNQWKKHDFWLFDPFCQRSTPAHARYLPLHQ